MLWGEAVADRSKGSGGVGVEVEHKSGVYV